MAGKLTLLVFVTLIASVAFAQQQQQQPPEKPEHDLHLDDDGQIPQRAELEELRRLRAMLMEQKAEIKTLTLKQGELQSDIDMCQRKVTSYVDKAVARGKQKKARPDKYADTEYACIYDIINMSCPSDGMVFIISAAFGRNYNTSLCPGEDCCAPDLDRDCVEELADHNEAEWTNLKLACNYNNNCGFQHGPHWMNTCGQEQLLAHYLTVTYTCSNEQRAVQQIGFTAYNVGNNYYSNGAHITFDRAETNVGGHFDNSSTFTCPVDGLYFFTFNVMTYSSYNAYVSLQKADTVVASAYGDYYSSSQYVHAANSAVVHCSAGEDVHLESESSGYLYSTSYRYVTFSGFLISED